MPKASGAFVLAVAILVAASGATVRAASLSSVLDDAARLASLETVIVARDGAIVAERGYRGHSVTAPTNIKSASKAVIAALVGIAIDRGALEGVDQKVADILRDDIPANADPRIEDITVGNLLSMQAGLRRTSGANYGRWVASGNWVRHALAQPFDEEPGGLMQYSTGSSHLLSAILTEATGRSTRTNAEAWLAALDGFSIGGWDRDPQGIYLGGNQMAMSPRSLLAFGELFRNRGRAPDGTRVLSEAWIEQSWTLRTRSRYTGDGYGYGWFFRTVQGQEVRYAWGYGGQMLYVVPDLGLTVVMTSDSSARSRAETIADRDNIHALLAEIVAVLREREAG